MADNFVLYLDECGDQNLSSFDPQFPIFTLCGVVVSEEQDELLADRINSCPQGFVIRAEACADLQSAIRYVTTLFC